MPQIVQWLTIPGMRIVRLFGSLLLVMLLHTALAVVIVAIIFVQLFSTSTPLKEVLHESGAYQALVDDVARQVSEQITDTPNIDKATVLELAKESLDAGVVQEQAEAAIDAMYDWLYKEANQPEFTINFSGARAKFVSRLGNETRSNLAALPECTSTQQTQSRTSIGDFTCIPPGASIDEIVTSYEENLLASDEFLPEAELTSETLFSEIEYDFAGSSAPKIFNILDHMLWPSMVIVAVSSLAIASIAPNKRKGWRRVAGQYITAGLGLVLSAGILWLALDRLVIIEQGAELQTALVEALKVLLLGSFVIMAMSGAIILFGGLLLRMLVKKPGKS